MIITIDKKVPSINHLYWHRGNIKIIKKEARELKEYIDFCVKRDVKLFNEEIPFNKKLNVSIEIYENWLTKKNDVKRKDVDNRSKFLLDSIFKSLELDDKFIYELRTSKIQSNEEKAVVEIKMNSLDI